MQLLFKDYTNLVIKAYEERREANRLSRLQHLTTANIRKECLNIFDEKIRSGKQLEENTLRAFFGMSPTEKGFRNFIENYKADKFKPLQSLIKGEVSNPSIITVELLAWLIDFKPRPLAYAQKVFATTNEFNDQEKPGNGGNKKQEGDNLANGEKHLKSEISNAGLLGEETLIEEENKKHGLNKANVHDRIPKINLTSVIGITLVILCGVAYLISLQTTSGEDIYGNTKSNCMQWINDHFEKVPCVEQQDGLPILALNEKKIKSFRMITRVDTMTEWSIGKVYYIKDKGTIKYYTEAGNYPEDLTRPLKVLSPYMFDKYLRKKEDPTSLSK